jgi:hypothetical protein
MFMLKSHINLGVEYALREKRGPAATLQRVRVVEHIRGNRWKAEWIDPNPGLVHFVESGHLLAPWKEHKAFLKEEADDARLREHNGRTGYKRDSPLDKALHEVFESVGDKDVSYWRGVLSGPADAIERLRARAGMEVGRQPPYAYTDRSGVLQLPFDDTLEIAQRFSAAEPATVLISIEGTERKWSREAATPGEEHMAGLLNEFRASWALIRQWAGQDAAIAHREAEIQRLERLVWDAIYALQKAGLDREAGRLRRAIEKQ